MIEIKISSYKEPEWMQLIDIFFKNDFYKDRNAVLFVKPDNMNLMTGFIGSVRTNIYSVTKKLSDMVVSATKTGSVKITGMIGDCKVTYVVSMLNVEYNDEINKMINDKISDSNIKSYLNGLLNSGKMIFESMF